MGEKNVAEYTAAFAGQEALEDYLAGESEFFAVTADQIADVLGTLAPPVDQAALTGERAEVMAASVRRAGAQGIVGWRDDDLTHIRPWGFGVGDITVPVAIWQGREGQMVPLAHAEWLASHVAGARSHLVSGEGHISLFGKIHVILDDLLDLAGLR